MTMPNFLIIGAQRTGTTSLHNYLKQHPEIYMSVLKEPRFFAFDGEVPDFRGSLDREASVGRYQTLRSSSITNIEDYRALFEEVTYQKAIGEISPIYIYSPNAPKRIKSRIPDVKLVAILRDPVDRAYSGFFLGFRSNKKPLDEFIRAIQEEDINVQNIWSGHRHCIRRGFYYVQLLRYFSTFDPNQIKIYLYDDLRKDPGGLMLDMFRFLEVDDTFVPDTSNKFGTSVSIRNKNAPQDSFFTGRYQKAFIKFFLPKGIVQKMSTYIHSRNAALVKPTLPKEIRRKLIQIYKEDILKIQDLIHRDLSKWLEA